MIILLIVPLVTSFIVQPTNGKLPKIQDLIGEGKNRRILHQPLFPVSSSPSPPAPPPPANSGFPNPDQPFFPEVPTGPTPDQARQPPAPSNGTTVPNPIAPQPVKTTKKSGNCNIGWNCHTGVVVWISILPIQASSKPSR